MSNKTEKWILNVLRASLVLGFGGAIFEQNYSMMFLTVLTLLLTFLPYLFERKYKISLPVEIVLATVLFIYATLFLGEVRGFYQLFWWWDLVLHAGSAIVFGLVGFTILYILYKAERLKARPGLIAIFSFSFAIAIGAIWEIVEFAIDSIFGINMQKSGLSDTMWDLIVNTAGAGLASVGGYFYLKGKGNFIGSIAEKFVDENKRFLKK